MPTSPEKVAEGFQTYGVYYVLGFLVLFTIAVVAGLSTGKIMFSREVIAAKEQLEANTAIMANMENSVDAEVRNQLQKANEELKETKAALSNLTAQYAALSTQTEKQNEKLLDILGGVRDDLRDIKSRGGGRSA